MGNWKRKGQASGIILASIVLGLVAGGVGGGVVARAVVGKAGTAPGIVIDSGGHSSTTQVVADKDAIPMAVKKMDPSVVRIDTESAPSPQDIFERMWSGRGNPNAPVKAIGSGFIFDYNGRKLVMTNNHVVGDAQHVYVKTTDGKEYKAQVVGADEGRDLAVVELVGAPGDLVGASLGDSEKLVVGQWVIAMGNPYGFDNTVTVGVVSAKGYRPVTRNETRNVIQTDAAINPGNSGGPLCDLGGNVVGINYSIATTTGATVGIGFAIPINEAKMVAKVLINGGPWIGLSEGDLVPNSKGFAAQFQLPSDKGVVVIRIVPGTPAAQAGLKPGDIILAVDGKLVSQSAEVTNPVLTKKIGDTMQFTVQRPSGTTAVTVTLGKMPARQPTTG